MCNKIFWKKILVIFVVDSLGICCGWHQILNLGGFFIFGTLYWGVEFEINCCFVLQHAQPNYSGKCNITKSCTEYSQNICSVCTVCTLIDSRDIRRGCCFSTFGCTTCYIIKDCITFRSWVASFMRADFVSP